MAVATLTIILIFKRYQAKHELSLMLLILCEVSLSLVATGLGFLFTGDFIAGGMYLIIAFVMVMLTSSELTLFKHIFFTIDK